jgi:serine phosphatase RsbU (regulator of sigma subunit)
LRKPQNTERRPSAFCLLKMSKDTNLQSSLLAHLRHELRTPINAIIGYSEMLLEEEEIKTDPTIENKLDRIHNCGLELLSLVNTILNPASFDAIDLSALYQAIYVEVEIHVNTAIACCQQLEEQVNPEIVPDLNKILFATKKLLETIEYTIDSSQQESELNNDRSNEIVALFYRETSEAIEGLKKDVSEGNDRQTQAATILVVDDSEINRDLISRQIEAQGHRVITAINGEQAIEKIQTGDYDLILLDVIMPKMNGYQVLEWIFHSEWRHIPVIMISALDEIDSVVKCIEMGAEDYLPKTFNPTLLKARIGACLKQKQARDRETHYLTQLAQANQEITNLNERLQAENLRMSTELEVTRRLQQMMLPKERELLEISQLDIAGFMEPAEEVGGDYYDILQQNDRVTIGIGDVTGHGLESGVLTIVAQTAIRTLIEYGVSNPEKILEVLNRTVYKNLQRMNSSKNMTLALLDYHQGKLTLSGQHEEAIVVRSDGTVENLDTIDLGFPIGLEENIDDFLDRTEIQLYSEDLVALYTDGVTEADNSEGIQYGLERLCKVIQQNRQRSALEIRQSVIDDLRQYIGEHKIYDDITLLILKQK